MNKSVKKHLMTVLRVVVCVSLLWLVVRGVTYYDTVTTRDGVTHRSTHQTAETLYVLEDDGQEREIPRAEVAVDEKGEEKIHPGLRTAIAQSEKAYLWLYLLIFIPIPLIQSFRFQWLLRAQDIHITYWESVKLCVAGNFLNFTLVGTTGGDVFKAYYVALHTDLKTEAVTTILLDRIVGLVGLLMMVGLVVLPFAWNRLPREIVYLVVLSLAGTFAGALLFLSPPLRALVEKLPLERMPMGSHLRRAESATRRLLRHRGLLFGSVVATVVIHFLFTTCVFCAAMALRMHTDGDLWMDYYAYIASGNIVAAIPVSFMGLGTMELFYKTYFTTAHGTLAQILILAMSVRIVNLFWSLPGALITLTGAYRPPPKT